MIDEIKSNYSKAIRTALLAQDKLTNKWYHLFSVIELMPFEIQEYNIPNETWYKNEKHPSTSLIRSNISSDIYSFYLIVQDFDINTAIALFENPIINNVIDEQINSYFNSSFIKEPSGESPLVLPSNIYVTEGLASALPKRNSGLFVWSQIDYERKVENRFRSEIISKEMKAMSQLTKDWLGFDIWAKPEHIGNIYMIASNPYFRDLDITLSNTPVGIFYHFKFRKQIQEHFKVRVIDKHGDHIALDKQYVITEPIGIIELPHEPKLIELRIYNHNDDLIAIHPPATFIKGINIDMRIKHADFNVKVQDKEKIKEFTVEKYSGERPIAIEKTIDFNSAYYFKNAELNRTHISLEQSNEFIFFPGGKTVQEKSDLKVKAKATIRSIINNTREICFLCDPYFNLGDLIEYAFYIENSGVKINIINAKDNIGKSGGTELLNAINQYNNKLPQKIDCRVLRGDSILHDRFIISDKNVWFLGSSFSEFGNRSTCIGKVPMSTNIQIIKEIEKWYYNDEYTQSLEDYIKSTE